MKETNSAMVEVPATTANLGPGFDTLGIALKLYNSVRVTLRAGRKIRVVSPLDQTSGLRATSMVTKAAELFFASIGQNGTGFEVSLHGEIPIARGLGSSATMRLGVVAALNHACQSRLSRHELLEIITELEGHPDNAAPAIFGGFTAAGRVGNAARCLRFPVEEHLQFVTLIPRWELSTKEARKVIPQSFSRVDAVHNLNRAALVTAAFASRHYNELKGLFDDRIHQPYREQLIAPLTRVIQAGEAAGAIGGWLSGSGSTIICLTAGKAEAVGQAMLEQLLDADLKILTADNRGYRVIEG